MAIKRAVRWLLVLAWLCLIVFLCQQNGADSAKVSDWITQRTSSSLKFLGFEISYSRLYFFLRKFAHYGVHLILAWLTYRALDVSFSGQRFNIALCVIICSIIAVFDESIQSVAVGRVMQASDAILNLFGVQTGTILGVLIAKPKTGRSS